MKPVTLKVSFGPEQRQLIDSLISAFKEKGLILESTESFNRAKNLMHYEILLKDVYSVYLFGHAQANGARLFFSNESYEGY